MAARQVVEFTELMDEYVPGLEKKHSVARFDGFELDLRAGELRSHKGNCIRLSGQPFRILTALLEHPSEVVLREEIRKALWPNNTVVEFEHSINAAMKRLRQALGDSAEEPRYIETLARRGYRWMLPVEWVESADLESGVRGASPVPANSDVSNLIGKKVSHYRVLEVIGGGGMGVVYRAEDLKLGRRVALKFLPDEMASDPAARERFEREARAASALDHRNICSIYEFGEHEAQTFIAMQLLEGEALRERIGAGPSQPGKPLPTRELLDLAMQVIQGLGAAHEKGIIHRDIKPANVFITTQGEAKILDFGVAKLVQENRDASSDAHSGPPGNPPQSHLHSLKLTRTGTTVGTAGYMSPEQIRGEKLDMRTDLFSFGLVLYEMATGQQAFCGETVDLIRQAILYRSVKPAREFNQGLPSKVEDLITKCLHKNRDARYQTASEVLADLERLKEELDPAGHLHWRNVAVGVALSLLVVSAAVWFVGRRQVSSLSSRDLRVRQLTSNAQEKGFATGPISPDGRYLAYSDATGVHVELVETGDSHVIEGFQADKADWEVAGWFPDSTRFLVNSHPLGEDQTSWSSLGSSIWAVSVFGDVPRKLRDNAYSYSVSPDGSLISFGTNKGRLGDREIWVMDANGEHARKLFDTGQNSTVGGLVWSPSGHWTLYQVQDDSGTAIMSRDLNGGAPNTVVPSSPSNNGSEYLWLPDNRLVYISPGPQDTNRASCTFWQQRIDPNSALPLDKPTCLAYWPATHISDLSVSADGKRLAFRKLIGHNTTYVADLNAKGTGIANPRHFTLTDSVDLPVGWTRDSSALIIVSNRTGQFGIYRQVLNEDTSTPVVPPAAGLSDVSISPDGNWILYSRSEEPGTLSRASEDDVLRVPVAGGSPDFVARVRGGSLLRCARSPSNLCVVAEPTEDRKQLVVSAFDPMKGFGSELVRFTPDSIANAWRMDLSPDGTRIAAIGGPEGPIQILSLRGQPTQTIHVKGWNSMHTLDWAADGKGVLVSNSIEGGAALLRVDLRGNAQVVWKNPGVNWTPCLESPDGRHLAFQSAPMEGNVWMVENF